MRTALLSLVAILVIAGGSFGVIKWLQKTAPEAEKKPEVKRALVVETETVQESDLKFALASEGVVRTRRDTVLSAEVAGRIVEVDPRFEVGASFDKGEMVARIDPVDYEAAVAQAAAALADARLGLVQEEARAEQAIRDWEKIGGGREATDLVKRGPFLRQAEARVKAAKAGLRQAETNLERTVIRAPFTCRVRAVNLNLGATVVPGAQLGTIYDGDNLLIRLPFSLDDYSLIPDNPTIELATTISGVNYAWEAEMMWELGEVDEETFSAYVLGRILANEENAERFRLPLPGTFLNARLTGAVLPEVVGVPREAVRGRDEVFVLSPEKTLLVRKLTVARRTADFVYATAGVRAGEKVILTKIEMPVPGMLLEEAVPVPDDDPPTAE